MRTAEEMRQESFKFISELIPTLEDAALDAVEQGRFYVDDKKVPLHWFKYHSAIVTFLKSKGYRDVNIRRDEQKAYISFAWW